MTKYRLERLSNRPKGWDALISQYATTTLFHTEAWLDHVQSIHPAGRMEYYEVKQENRTIGYHCGLRIRKAGLPIHGSPLGGTGTNYMGPIVGPEVEQEALVKAIVRLFGFRTFLHVELSSDNLDPKVMRRLGFRTHENVTHLVRLPETVEAGWAGLRSTARNRIRKSERSGLVAEQAKDDTICEVYFEQLTDVFRHQGLQVPYDADRPMSLYRCLVPHDKLLPLSIKRRGEIIATGLFPYDERCIYFWGGAAWIKDRKWHPNELLHWKAMEFAISRGIRAYNMCGGTSQFKNKFGGEDVPYLTYSKSALSLLQAARNAYRAYHFHRLRRAG